MRRNEQVRLVLGERQQALRRRGLHPVAQRELELEECDAEETVVDVDEWTLELELVEECTLEVEDTLLADDVGGGAAPAVSP